MVHIVCLHSTFDQCGIFSLIVAGKMLGFGCIRKWWHHVEPSYKCSINPGQGQDNVLRGKEMECVYNTHIPMHGKRLERECVCVEERKKSIIQMRLKANNWSWPPNIMKINRAMFSPWVVLYGHRERSSQPLSMRTLCLFIRHRIRLYVYIVCCMWDGMCTVFYCIVLYCKHFSSLLYGRILFILWK